MNNYGHAEKQRIRVGGMIFLDFFSIFVFFEPVTGFFLLILSMFCCEDMILPCHAVARSSFLIRNRLTSENKAKSCMVFYKKSLDIDAAILQARTGKIMKEYLSDCVTLIKKIKDNEILQGLGELLSEKEKIWIKNHLRSETIFMLRNYISVL